MIEVRNMFVLVQLLFITIFLNVHGHQLKQVVIISRHNLRSPQVANLDLWSSKKWPLWKGDVGDLTLKGWRLERSMGEYFSDWMIEEKLFDNNCPKDEAYVYANTKQRTKETAKAFVEGAFGDCVNVSVKNITKMDPIFDLIIRNDSQIFKETAFNEMQKKFNGTELKDSFVELDKIVDFGNSPYCKTENICDLSEIGSDIALEVNKAPNFNGALRIGYNLVDALLMAYYDGLPLGEVAWGQIHTENQWKSLLSILNAFQELRFETKILNRHLASVFLKYFTNIFKNGTKKFYLIVGHDANISALLSSLNFKEYILQGQFEKTPIGGKVVFQKWYDEENDLDLLKVSYVYQSSVQIRNGVEVTSQNPPNWVTLQMENCVAVTNGFCLWNDFMSILSTTI